MRTLTAFILVFFNLSLAEAQINLVPNPSFEDTVYCPIGQDNKQKVRGTRHIESVLNILTDVV